MDIFAERFLQLKKEKRLTYQEIANALQLKMRTVQYYGSGRIKPDYHKLVQLADFYGISLDYLTGRNGNQEQGYEPQVDYKPLKGKSQWADGINFEKVFSARVRDLRLKKGISQKELGDAVGLSGKAISTIESGSRSTSMEKLVALAKYFSVTTDYLLGLTDENAQAGGEQE